MSEEKPKKSMALEAMLDMKKARQRVEEAQAIVGKGKSLERTLHLRYNVWDKYIDAAVEGKEFAIGIPSRRGTYESPHRFIEAKDRVLLAQSVSCTNPVHGHYMQEIRLDFNTMEVTGNHGHIDELTYNSFRERMFNAEKQTISSKRAEI